MEQPGWLVVLWLEIKKTNAGEIGTGISPVLGTKGESQDVDYMRKCWKGKRERAYVCTFTTVSCSCRRDIIAHYAAIVELYRGYLFDHYWYSWSCPTVATHPRLLQEGTIVPPAPYYCSGCLKRFQFLFYNLDESIKGRVRNDASELIAVVLDHADILCHHIVDEPFSLLLMQPVYDR